MRKVMLAAAATAAIGLAGGAAHAESLKIGFLATLSGPPAVLGEHMRDGFLLGVKQAGGKLGGLDTEVLVVDDELKPDAALTKVRGLLERDEVDMMAGVVFSNVMMAVYKPIMESETIFVGGNAGPLAHRGQGVLALLLHHVLPERPEPRGDGQIRPGCRLQAHDRHGAELSGRQGFDRRFQAPLQGRDR